MGAAPRTDFDGILDSPSIVREAVQMTLYGRHATCAKVICPSCKKDRWVPLGELRRSCRQQAEFTGMCRSCSDNSSRKAIFSMEGVPDHPAIIREPVLRDVNGRKNVFLKVVCTQCSEETWWQLSTLRKYHSTFHGMCKTCWRSGHAKGRMRSSRNPTGTRINSLGYIALSRNAIADEDTEWFYAMRQKGNYVLAHRWVMAKVLGRPLISSECVDHRDGDKTNNHIDNLRLYRKGKNEEGSGNGYGTYYHEWQMALAENRRLQAALDAVTVPVHD